MRMSVFQFPFFVVTLVAAVICLQYGQAHNTHRLNNDAKHHDKRDVWYGDFGFDLEPVEQLNVNIHKRLPRYTGVWGRYGVLVGDPAESSISQENAFQRRPRQMFDGMLNRDASSVSSRSKVQSSAGFVRSRDFSPVNEKLIIMLH